jgi:hypothetical protein
LENIRPNSRNIDQHQTLHVTVTAYFAQSDKIAVGLYDDQASRLEGGRTVSGVGTKASASFAPTKSTSSYGATYELVMLDGNLILGIKAMVNGGPNPYPQESLATPTSQFAQKLMDLFRAK